MRKDFEILFSQLEAPKPPARLCQKIMRRIEMEENLMIAKRKLVLFSMMLMASVVSLFPFFQMARTELMESGFTDYLSLLFSDFGEITRSWQSFGLALLESLPAMSLAACLLSLFIGFSSLKFLWTSINFPGLKR